MKKLILSTLVLSAAMAIGASNEVTPQQARYWIVNNLQQEPIFGAPGGVVIIENSLVEWPYTNAIPDAWPDAAMAATWCASNPAPNPDVTVPLMAGGKVIGTARIVVDAATMEPLAVINSASPQRSIATQVAELSARQQSNSAHRDRLAAIESDLNTVEDAMAATNWTDIVVTNIFTSAATWTNANQRGSIVAIKDALQAAKSNENAMRQAIKNLRQATNKIRGEIR